MDDETNEQFEKLHAFLFDRVYTNSKAKREERKVDGILMGIFEHIKANPNCLPKEYNVIVERDGLERAIIDHIAGMSDHYAVEVYSKYFIPKSWELDV